MAEPKLREYRRKRDPKKTAEPFASGRKRGKKPLFVVQRHDARRLHYDLRLERDGVLASWAVPKGIPLEPGLQHLAVHVEDHPLSYGTFEGEIPKGEYGAGTVEIWDTGTYEVLEEKPNGGLTVRLEGRKLDGVWGLVPAKLGGDEKNWLLIRKREEGTAPGGSQRRYAPMLATLAETNEMPRGDGWEYEIKWDGYRIVARVAGGEAQLRTRKDQDYTQRFDKVARELVKALKTPDCVVDGEVCALDENGRPSFSAMQQAKAGTPIVYYVFDLLEVDGEPVIDLPLSERRARLRKLLDGRNRTVLFSESFDDGKALLRAAEEQHLEGIMGKRLESRYLPGKRSPEWLKYKTHGEQELVIVGYTRGKGRREWSFGSLVLAVNGAGGLEWVGNVGTGFDEDEIERLLGKLRPLERKDSPFPEAPKMPRIRKGDVVWVEPKLVARSRSRSGRTTAASVLPSTSGCARTRIRARCAASCPTLRPFRRSSARASACCGSRTSTSRSGWRRGSRRATCSRSTATSRPCSCRTCATGRSRSSATRTAGRATTSSRRTRPPGCPSGSGRSTSRSRRARSRDAAGRSARRS